MFTAYGVAAIGGPMMAAYLKTSSGGSYTMPFIISLILNVIGLALILVMINKKKKKEIASN